MTRTRWTRRDDAALAEQMDAEQYAHEVLPAIAEHLGVDPADLRIESVRVVNLRVGPHPWVRPAAITSAAITAAVGIGIILAAIGVIP